MYLDDARRAVVYSTYSLTNNVAVDFPTSIVPLFSFISISTYSYFQAIKRPTSVQVTNQNVVISDKAGDAYSYDLDLTNRKYLLGHVSVVMDMLLTPDNKFLVTCDR